MLLDAEGCALLLHLDDQHHVEVHVLGRSLLVVLAVLVVFGVVSVLHIVAAMLPVGLANALLHKVGTHVLTHEVASLEVHHGSGVACLVYYEEAGNACITCHLGVIGTKGRRDVHNAGTVLGGHIVAGDDAESLCRAVHHLVVHQVAGLHPRHQLLVVQTHQVCSHTAPQDFGSRLSAVLILGSGEMDSHPGLCQDVDSLLVAVWVLAFYCHVFYLRAHAERCV